MYAFFNLIQILLWPLSPTTSNQRWRNIMDKEVRRTVAATGRPVFNISRKPRGILTFRFQLSDPYTQLVNRLRTAREIAFGQLAKIGRFCSQKVQRSRG